MQDLSGTPLSLPKQIPLSLVRTLLKKMGPDKCMNFCLPLVIVLYLECYTCSQTQRVNIVVVGQQPCMIEHVTKGTSYPPPPIYLSNILKRF